MSHAANFPSSKMSLNAMCLMQQKAPHAAKFHKWQKIPCSEMSQALKCPVQQNISFFRKHFSFLVFTGTFENSSVINFYCFKSPPVTSQENFWLWNKNVLIHFTDFYIFVHCFPGGELYHIKIQESHFKFWRVALKSWGN